MKNLDKYEALVAEFPEIKRKGKANPYTSLNGHMFSFLDKEGKVSIRFSGEDQKSFMTKYDASYSIQYGSTMRGYAVIPDDMLNDLEKLKPYFQLSIDYVKSLKPKPLKRK